MDMDQDAGPIRHLDSNRNRLKALHQVDTLWRTRILSNPDAKRRVNLKYAYSKARKLESVDYDGKR